jgi:hypothetical protein
MRSWHRPMQGPAHDIDCRTRRGNWPMPATAHGHGGPIQRYGRQGYKGVAVLGFNPNPPLPFSLVCVAALDLAFSTMCFGLDPCHLSHSSPRRRGLPTPLLTTPLHCLPHPCTRSMWHSRPMREFPSSRSATWAARVRNMCELVEDTAPMGLSSGGGMVFACCSGGCGGGVMETVDCVVVVQCGRLRPEAVVVAAVTPQIRSWVRSGRSPSHRFTMLGFQWVNPLD